MEHVPPEAKVEPVPPHQNLVFQAHKSTRLNQFDLKAQKIHSNPKSTPKSKNLGTKPL